MKHKKPRRMTANFNYISQSRRVDWIILVHIWSNAELFEEEKGEVFANLYMQNIYLLINPGCWKKNQF